LRTAQPQTTTYNGVDGTWEEVTREWVALAPQTGSEFVNATQTTATSKLLVYTTFSPSMADVTTKCRMKIAKLSMVNEDDPNADENYRIFNIEDITNVREQNRELQLLVTEKV
jgi:head-tail adaptor